MTDLDVSGARDAPTLITRMPRQGVRSSETGSEQLLDVASASDERWDERLRIGGGGDRATATGGELQSS